MVLQKPQATSRLPDSLTARDNLCLNRSVLLHASDGCLYKPDVNGAPKVCEIRQKNKTAASFGLAPSQVD